MEIGEAIASRKKELDEIQSDIERINSDAERLKPAVQEYNEKKSKAAELKKILKQKQRDLNTVYEFIQGVGGHYLDEVFPLFAKPAEGVIENDSIFKVN